MRALWYRTCRLDLGCSTQAPVTHALRHGVLLAAVKALHSIVGNNNHLFEADAELIGQVYSWLNSEYHACFKNDLVFRGYIGAFVNIDAQTMARSVSKVRSIAAISDGTACCIVDFAGANTWSNNVQRCLHGGFYDGVYVIVF